MKNPDNNEKIIEEGYFLDDGSKIDPSSVPIPYLCTTCMKNNDPTEEIACNMTRIDQTDDVKNGAMFCCFAYEPINPSINKELKIKEMEEYLERRF